NVEYDYVGKQSIPTTGLSPASPTALWAADPDPDSFRPQNQRSRTQNRKQTRPQPPVERGWADKADSRPPLRGPGGWGAIGTSGMPLTASGRERPPDSDACKQAPRSWVS